MGCMPTGPTPKWDREVDQRSVAGGGAVGGWLVLFSATCPPA